METALTLIRTRLKHALETSLVEWKRLELIFLHCGYYPWKLP